MPGLINAHVHNPMTLMRGVADDLPLMRWLTEHIWPIESAIMGPEYCAIGVELAVAEMLRGGTTCASENYFFPDVCAARSEEHTSELQSLMRILYAVFCLKKKNK